MRACVQQLHAAAAGEVVQQALQVRVGMPACSCRGGRLCSRLRAATVYVAAGCCELPAVASAAA